MKLKLVRTIVKDGFVEGKLYIDDVFECYTVEDTDRHLEAGGTKVQNATAIPKGEYTVIMSASNRFKKILPEVLNVPGFSGIRIHSGNSSKDTEGCIIVGSVNTKTDDDWVGGSVIALGRLMPKLNKAFKAKQPITLEVV